jgi:hypothetical protein
MYSMFFLRITQDSARFIDIEKLQGYDPERL